MFNFKYMYLQDTSSCPWQGGAEFPGSASPVTRSKIIGASRLTRDDAVKTGYCLTLDTGVCKLLLQSFGKFSVRV